MAQTKTRQYFYFVEKPIDNESIILFNVEEKLYDKALELINGLRHDLSPRLIVAKAKCLLGLDRNEEALDVLINAEKVDWDLPQILMLKGFALFKLKEYHTAKMTFERCFEIRPSQEIKRWIQRCLVHLSANNEEISRRVIRYEPQLTHCPSPQLNPQLKQQFEQLFQLPPQQPTEQTASQQQPQQAFQPSEQQQIEKQSTQEQLKLEQYEWYQSQAYVTMVLYKKDLQRFYTDESDVNVKFDINSFDIIISSKQEIKIHIKLAKNIDPSQSSFSLTPKKIEIKMKKQVEGQWSLFEERP